MKRFQQWFVLSVLFLSTPVTTWAAEGVDNSLYADLLETYVKDGVVDYQGFQNEEKKLDAYLKTLEETDPDKLPLDEQFAFYINAYNAWTIKLILSGYPELTSIKDLGGWFSSPFKKKICRIDGEVVSLAHMEHEILRPRFKDPRVHFAINCASKSCPPLRSEPYRGAVLEEQLNDATRSFINDPEENYLTAKVLYVSRIFKWFSEDFNDDVVGFFLEFAEGDFKERIEVNRPEMDVEYLDYDWSLNGK